MTNDQHRKSELKRITPEQISQALEKAGMTYEKFEELVKKAWPEDAEYPDNTFPGNDLSDKGREGFPPSGFDPYNPSDRW